MNAKRVQHLVKVSLLFLTGLSSIEGQKLNIAANISPSGGLCQNSVTFSCTAIGVEDGTFSWYLNGDAIGSRVYNPNDIYPFTVNSSIADFCIQMMNVTITNSRLFNFINFTLTIQLMKISNYVGRNITCGQLLIQSSQITINSYHLQALKAPDADDINFIAHYDRSNSIVSEVTVNWNVLEEFCTELNTDYEVRLTSNSAILYSKNETCKVNTDCQVTFMIMPVLMANVYWIEIVALDEDGVVSNASRCPDPIDIQPNISIEFLSCAVVKCYSTFNGTCEIQYSQNVTTSLNNSVNGNVNSDDIEVSMLQSGMVYYIATFNVNGNAYILQSHTTVKCEKKVGLSDGALAGIIAVAVVVIIVSVTLVIIVLTLLWKKAHCGNEKNPQIKPTDEAKVTLTLHGMNDENAQQKNKQGLTKAEEYVSGAGHRRYGESTQEGALRVKETIHQAIVQKQNIYDKINRERPDTEEKQNLPTEEYDEEYDSLNYGGASQRQKYDALKHSGTEQQVPPVHAVPRPGADDYDHIALANKDSKNKGNIGGNTIAPIGGDSVRPPQQGPRDTKQYKRSNGKH